MDKRGATAYAAEFVGTFLLVLFIGLILSVQQVKVLGGTDFAVVGLVHVFTLGMLVSALGGTSGAHFNPAVTVTLAGLRKIKVSDAGIYIVLQLAGAVCAALVVKLLLNDEGNLVNYGAPSVNTKILSNDSAGMLAELIGTFVLMYAIMAVAVNVRAERAWAPWVIGGTLGMAVMCIGPLTGAGFNPARSFGPALVANAFGGGGTFLYVYCLGPIVGALAAGLIYHHLVIAPETRPIDKLG
jgi:MIP family channel proteins